MLIINELSVHCKSCKINPVSLTRFPPLACGDSETGKSANHLIIV